MSGLTGAQAALTDSSGAGSWPVMAKDSEPSGCQQKCTIRDLLRHTSRGAQGEHHAGEKSKLRLGESESYKGETQSRVGLGKSESGGLWNGKHEEC